MEELEQDQPRSIAQIRRANEGAVKDEGSDHPGTQNETSDVSKNEDKVSHPTSIGNLCRVGDDNSSVSLICGWSAYIGTNDDSLFMQGQHHLSQLIVRPKKKKRGCPLTITSNHASMISHDFSAGLLVSHGDCALCYFFSVMPVLNTIVCQLFPVYNRERV